MMNLNNTNKNQNLNFRTMKRNLLTLLSFTLVFMGCERDDTADIVINDNSVTTINNGGGTSPEDDVVSLSGVYTADLTLDSEKDYVIRGPLLMSFRNHFNYSCRYSNKC